MSMTIQEFGEKVMSLRPNNFMALNGAAPGIIGSADSGTNAIVQLQRATISFMQIYQQGMADELQAARKDVTGKIMVALTVDALTEQKADELLEALQQLMKERN